MYLIKTLPNILLYIFGEWKENKNKMDLQKDTFCDKILQIIKGTLEEVLWQYFSYKGISRRRSIVTTSSIISKQGIPSYVFCPNLGYPENVQTAYISPPD